MNLSEQQAALQAAICAEPGMGDAGGVSPPAGLAVYRHAYRARLEAALRDNYLVLHRALGDTAFERLAAAYLERHPSGTRSIRWFGAGLADFMQDWTELPHPALADLARMDWALRDAFDAPDAEPLRAEDLAGLGAQTRLRLHPSVRLVPLQWAVEPAWRALRLAISEEAEEAELPAPEPQSHVLLAWRQGLEVRWRSLASLEAALLVALAQGADFAALGERAAALVGEANAPQALVAALQTWLADDLLEA